MVLKTCKNGGRQCLGWVASFAMALLLILSGEFALCAQMPPLGAPAPARSLPRTPPVPGGTLQGGVVHGTVKNGTIPLPAVRIIATNMLTGKRFITTTDVTGAYSINLPHNGSYQLRTGATGLVSSIREVLLGTTGRDLEVNFILERGSAFQAENSGGTESLASLWPAPALPALTNSVSTSGAQLPSFVGDASVSAMPFVVDGQPVIANPFFEMGDSIRQYFENGPELQGSPQQPDSTNAPVGQSVNTGNSQHGQLHGEIFWTGGNSVLNAEPFVLAGATVPNPSYYSNNYGLTVGVQPFIPGLTKPSRTDFILVSFSGLLSKSLVNNYGLVPTALEREGNFSQLVGPTGTLTPIYSPRTLAPYPNNTIDTPLDSAAEALLQYLPEPNLQSTGLNYRLLTTLGTHANVLGISYTHNFSAPAGAQSSAAGQVANNGQARTQSINVNFNLGRVASDVVNLFPQFGGKQWIQGYSLAGGYTIGKGDVISNINVSWNHNNSELRNHFTDVEDVATEAGVFSEPDVPLNLNKSNYGLPDLVLNNFTGVSETQPNFQLTQIFAFSGSSSWSRGTHNLRFGGDVRLVDYNMFGGTNATGTFIFTGGYTQKPGTTIDSNPISASGSSFADFLIGRPQETKIEAAKEKARARQNNWDVFVRDDWRALSNLTILAGVRYDSFPPYTEVHNRLSTLDYNSDFSKIAPVKPNGVGRISGAQYPRTLIYRERNNFSPHLGFAWQASRDAVVRAAYGINYTVNQYGSFIQDLAYQPPFANVQTNGNIPQELTSYTLQYGFGNLADFGNYAVNKNYRLPYVQIWYLDVQQSLPLGIVLDVGYSGAKGTRLDIINTPGPINNDQPFASAYFDFDDSRAFSNFNALVVRANKRLQNGIALQATYSYSHSIDNASSINADSPVVAQNWQDLLAEEGNSSFDIRHQVTGSFLYQLPFGPNKQFWNNTSWASHVLGDWSISGYLALATGIPLTPFVAASVAEVERGTHGSVRPNRVPGVSIRAGGGHIRHWFNTAAFSTDFAPNQRFGTAARNSIPGPGTENVNLSLSKVFNFKESKSLQVRGTANNAFNIVQYSGVNTQFDSSTVGQVDAVQPMRQITFLAQFKF